LGRVKGGKKDGCGAPTCRCVCVCVCVCGGSECVWALCDGHISMQKLSPPPPYTPPPTPPTHTPTKVTRMAKTGLKYSRCYTGLCVWGGAGRCVVPVSMFGLSLRAIAAVPPHPPPPPTHPPHPHTPPPTPARLPKVESDAYRLKYCRCQDCVRACRVLG
jgi:hypothetical protein